ncbi:ras GEF [Salix suchowensis]|nr:ras GEF [Salix suchowensis]
MTYRTYINAVDLCHLLICRFHWALAQPSSPTDERVRRIVRVRTFVAIRYWLLTFFVVDFTPNRELRLLVANWLNTLVRDPTLQQHSDGLSIVRKLRRVAKDCKKANTRANHAPSSQPRPPKPEHTKPEHVLGEKFAEATRQLRPEDEDSDVDLDFLDDAIPDVADTTDAPASRTPIRLTAQALPAQHPFLYLRSISSNKPNGLLAWTRAGRPFVQTPATLPIHHSALSRVIVKTIGRLGRWKRVLNSRATVRAPLGVCGDVSAFDLELTASRDLLMVNGGVEQYLKMIEPGPDSLL